MSEDWDLTDLEAPAGRLRKLARSTMPSFKVRRLKEQGGLCPLCKNTIDLRIKGEGVIDHDHDTGEIRGILHRSCNAAEGKVANAAGRWGAGGMGYDKIIPWLRNMLEYLESPGTGLMYHTHLTEDEKRLKRNKEARTQRAVRKARTVVRAKT
jgi:hypothetical protein